MRCYSCAKLSIDILCSSCRERLFVPSVQTRRIGTLDVISFYRYTALEPLLLTKHKPEGYRVYRRLAEMTFRPFIQEFVEHDEGTVYIVGIDERVESGYSHTALLSHAMKTEMSIPQHASQMAQNRVHYAGKPLQYRLDNPRDFRYTGRSGVDVILVDDIITTGITLQEAQQVLLSHDVNVLFALTLADAKE